jgi:hypothetical protein
MRKGPENDRKFRIELWHGREKPKVVKPVATNSDEDVAAYNDEDEEGDEHLEEADFDGGIFSNHVGRLRNNKECW